MTETTLENRGREARKVAAGVDGAQGAGRKAWGPQQEARMMVEGKGRARVGKARAGAWRKRVRWDLVFLAGSIIAFAVLSLLYRDKGARALRVSWEFLQELVLVLPAVMVLMGLFAVWVKRETVVKYLGRESGLSGLLLSILLGTLPTGPLYVAFPLAAMLLKKGARVANVTVFLSAWACIKLPLELMELQFLGWRFTFLRLGLTVTLVIPVGLLAEKLYHSRPAGKPGEPTTALGGAENEEAGQG